MKRNGRTLYLEREKAGASREAVAAHMFPGADPAAALAAVAKIEQTDTLDSRTMGRHRAAVLAVVDGRPAQAAPAILLEPARERAQVSIAVLATLTRLDRAEVEAAMGGGQSDPVKAAAVAAALVSLLGSKLELAAEREKKAREEVAQLRVQLADAKDIQAEQMAPTSAEAVLLHNAREVDTLLRTEVQGDMPLAMRFRRLLGRECPRVLERMSRLFRAQAAQGAAR